MPNRPLIVSVLAILDLVAAVLYGLFAWGLWREVDNAPSFLFMALALAVAAVLHVVAGQGLWRLRPYGRVMQLVFAWIGMLGIPCGPLLSIVVIVALRRPTVRAAFSASGAHARMSPGPGTVWATIVGLLWFAWMFQVAMLCAGAVESAHAFQRAKMKRTSSEIRTLATAVMSYQVDHHHYPQVETVDELLAVLVPDYVHEPVGHDAWGHELRYQWWTNGAGDAGSDSYAIASPGRDGIWAETDLKDYAEGQTDSFDQDMVSRDGLFVRHPNLEARPETR